MKVKTDFELRQVAGENIIVATGKAAKNFSRLISLNESAAYLWQEVSALPSFDDQDVAELLTQKYGIGFQVAMEDAGDLTQRWLDAGIVEA